MGGDDPPRHILAHALGIPREGIAPAAAAAGLEAEEVAALENDAVAEGGQLALARRARIEDDASRPPRETARHAVGRDERVLHARGQLRALAEHAHVADHARPAAMAARSARLRPHRVALDAQREVALYVLNGVVLLGDVVDDVDAVGEGPRAQAHSEPLDAEDGPPARLVPGAEVVEDIDGGARGHLAPIGLGEGAEDAGHDAEARVGAHAQGGGEARLEQAALAGDPLVEIAEEPLVDVEVGIEGLEIAAEGDAEEARVGDEVDGTPRLVVGAGAVEGHVVAATAEGEIDTVRPGLDAPVAVEKIVEGPLSLGNHLQEELARAHP